MDAQRLHDTLKAGETAVVLVRPGNPTTARMALGVKRGLFMEAAPQDADRAIDDFLAQSKSPVFGWLGYDLKNAFERLESRFEDRLGFGALGVFEPIETGESALDFGQYRSSAEGEKKITLTPRISKQQYLDDVRALQEHIQRGDIYEVNYCQEFYAENVAIDPLDVFSRLLELTDAPHSALVHHQGAWLLCGSPERYLRRSGSRLISQPIKGTVRRGATAEEDAALARQLQSDPKERGENIMITDLVRNDLARAGMAGSVRVDELCGIYSFRTVHQMISTVSAEVDTAKGLGHVLRASFPMGSMTGAPKVRAMELIDRYEHFSRGLYSGSVGVVEPNGDFDFNVIIRSIFWNANTGYLSVRVGGAITALSDPEAEYNECLLKAEAMVKALG